MYNICHEIHGVHILLFCSLVEERGIVSWLVFKKILLMDGIPTLTPNYLRLRVEVCSAGKGRG